MANKKSLNRIIGEVERAVAEIRRGQIVGLKNHPYVFGSPETLDEKTIINFKKLAKTSWVLITPKRANYILNCTSHQLPCMINIESLPLELVYKMCGLDIEDILPTHRQKMEKCPKKDSKENGAILKVAKIAELIPCLLVFEKSPKLNKYIKDEDVIEISSESIKSYEKNISGHLDQVSAAPLVLKDAENCKMVAFRPRTGGKEHYAIIVGNPSDTPLIRIHSSCYTGDLLGSLRCDCRDQLHEAIKYMNDNGGGIVLYLIQEGRGIGLVNKLRAYDLQTKDYDTVEANEVLGFDDDERPFLPAATMLKKLGYKAVRLLTNNPKKAEELQKLGIKVKQMLPLITRIDQHNKEYLKTKTKKMRHIISI